MLNRIQHHLINTEEQEHNDLGPFQLSRSNTETYNYIESSTAVQSTESQLPARATLLLILLSLSSVFYRTSAASAIHFDPIPECAFLNACNPSVDISFPTDTNVKDYEQKPQPRTIHKRYQNKFLCPEETGALCLKNLFFHPFQVNTRKYDLID